MTAPVLSVQDLRSGYGEKQVIRGVSLGVAEGRTLAILGPNGAGKTTLLKTMSGLLKPTAGKVLVDGEDMAHVTPHDRVARGLCHIPDPRGIFRTLTVRENLLLQAPKGQTSEAVERATTAFPRLGQRLSQVAGTMSGGEQQMLAVARSYVQHPRVVLLDEVSMGLAPNLVDEIFQFLGTLSATGVALIIVEQFVHRSLAMADEVVVLTRGRISLTGPADAFDEEDIFNAYVGARSEGELARA